MSRPNIERVRPLARPFADRGDCWAYQDWRWRLEFCLSSSPALAIDAHRLVHDRGLVMGHLPDSPRHRLRDGGNALVALLWASDQMQVGSDPMTRFCY